MHQAIKEDLKVFALKVDLTFLGGPNYVEELLVFSFVSLSVSHSFRAPRGRLRPHATGGIHTYAPEHAHTPQGGRPYPLGRGRTTDP